MEIALELCNTCASGGSRNFRTGALSKRGRILGLGIVLMSLCFVVRVDCKYCRSITTYNSYMSIIQNFLTNQIVDDEIIILMTPSCLYALVRKTELTTFDAFHVVSVYAKRLPSSYQHYYATRCFVIALPHSAYLDRFVPRQV